MTSEKWLIVGCIMLPVIDFVYGVIWATEAE